MLGDTAVAVHPEDERYAHLIGKTVQPAADRSRDPGHRRRLRRSRVRHRRGEDHAGARLQRLRSRPAAQAAADQRSSTLDAKINDNAPEKYRGLDRFVARKPVLADLEALGLLVETKQHKLQVPRGERTDAVIEPMLTDQWFVT